MGPASQIIQSIIRGSSRFLTRSGGFGRAVRWMGQGNNRVVGKTKGGAKVAGRVSKTKSGKDVVVNPEGGHTFLGKGDKSRLLKGASNVSKVRKATIVGGAAGGGYAAGSTGNGTKKTTPEPTYTEKNPGGMRFSKAPSLKSTGIKAKQPKSSAGTFSKAFAKAYAGGKGKGSVFPWKGKDGKTKSYVALTKEDTGGKTIKEYYASKKKKKK